MSEQRQKKPTRRLMAVACELLHEGVGQKGPYKLYRVDVVNEAGAPVNQNFRSFAEVPLNELLEYQVEKRDTPDHGLTFTLSLPRPPAWKLIDALTERVDALEARIHQLEGQRSPGLSSEDLTPPGV